jgi:pimeloyl-ACP methyl ester carboxylesterase
MNHHTWPSGNLERRIHDAERDLFAAVGAEVEEFFLDLTRTGLAAITTPTIFILGSEDPYLSVERARTSIDQIQVARLSEVPGGHAPWLADAQHAGELIVTHSHLVFRS